MPRPLAVLTGDLIASTDLSAAQFDTAMAALRSAAEQLSGWGTIRHDTCFTPSRGDGWQIIVRPAELALRAALFLRASLRGHGKDYASRISIATGKADIPADGNLNQASGPAFVASGRGLNILSRWAEMRHADGGGVAAATRLADHISQGWTPTQARVMAEMLPPADVTQEEVARRFGKTQQAVQQALSGAGYAAIGDALELIEG